jgi:c-di-GMP-binding flagellar brake protein YcgR
MNEFLPGRPERRRYFRVEDEIILTYRPIPPEEVPDPEQFQSQCVDHFSLTSTLECLSRESLLQFRLIQRDHPEVAKYLEVLERKIQVLAQAFLLSANPLSDQPTRKVSLSASGLAFEAEQSLAEGQILELKLVVPPALVGILTFGKVVYCRLKEDSRYRIGVDFLALRDQDREFLIRHVVKRQLVQLRERKGTVSELN